MRNGTRVVTLLKGEEVPEWAEGRLDDKHIEEGDDKSPSTDADVELPPLKGPGSGRARWVEAAERHGIEVTDDMTKEEIIDLLK